MAKNPYLAIIEKSLKINMLQKQKIKWPILFQRFIDDGFGIMQGLKKTLNIE